MRLVTTDAIVLRTYNLAESDRIVVCLTRDCGLVRAVAKGARRMKSRFGAALEPFTLIKLSFNERENRDLVTLSAAEILKSNFDLNAQLEAAEVLAYMGELVSEFAPPHEADERLFRMLAACVEAVSAAGGAHRVVTRYFEIWLLRLAGLFPDLRVCAQCGRGLEGMPRIPVDADLRPHCVACRPGEIAAISAELLEVINLSQKLSPLKFAQSFVLSDRDDSELSDITHRLISRVIDRRPRTLVSSTR